MHRLSVRFVAGLSTVLVVMACTSSTTTVSTRSPEASPSASESASASASASASPSPSASVAALTVGSIPVHNGEVGLGYGTVTLSASGGVPPYSWSKSSGALPGGLSLSGGGQLTGTPSAAGGFSFTAKVSDSAGHSATGSAKVTIYPALKLGSSCSTVCYIGTGCKKCWGFGTASGGLTPYTYKTIAGAPPAAYSALSLTAPPAKAGPYTTTIQVTDAMGVSGNVKANWTIYSPAVLGKGPDCINYANPPSCTVRWTYTGGNPNTAPKLAIVGYAQYCNPNLVCGTPSGPPPSWSVTVSGGVVSMSAGGIPCNQPSYIGAVLIALTDPTACATSNSNVGTLNFDLENNC